MQNYECRIVSSRTGRDHSHPSWAESGANGGVKSEAEEHLLLRERNDSMSLGLVWPSVGRVDDAYGDRTLICECGTVDDYA